MINVTSDRTSRQGRTAQENVIIIKAAARRALCRGQHRIAKAFAEWAAHEAGIMRNAGADQPLQLGF